MALFINLIKEELLINPKFKGFTEFTVYCSPTFLEYVNTEIKKEYYPVIKVHGVKQEDFKNLKITNFVTDGFTIHFEPSEDSGFFIGRTKELPLV